MLVRVNKLSPAFDVALRVSSRRNRKVTVITVTTIGVSSFSVSAMTPQALRVRMFKT